MKLYTPNKSEAALLLTGPVQFNGLQVCSAALPPSFLLERSLIADDGGWRMPRLFCDETERTIVGSGIFKSAPKAGTVEIGYGISPACRSRGYATAGVILLLGEAFASGRVEAVIAEASPLNIASRRVLEKAGFSVFGAGVNDEGPVELWRALKNMGMNEPEAGARRSPHGVRRE